MVVQQAEARRHSWRLGRSRVRAGGLLFDGRGGNRGRSRDPDLVLLATDRSSAPRGRLLAPRPLLSAAPDECGDSRRFRRIPVGPTFPAGDAMEFQAGREVGGW